MFHEFDVDTVVVGGGPAGLQAALTMARMHRSALLLDHGHYRNDPTETMHNMVTHDGRPPAEFARSPGPSSRPTTRWRCATSR